MPFESGDYWCVDLMNNEQWYCQIFNKENAGLQVYETRTRETHNASDYDRPNIRWFRLNPIPREELDRAVSQGAAYETVGGGRSEQNIIGGTTKK
jgi:hypothetical protein